MKEAICKNCRLFDPKNKLCAVVIVHEGEKTNLPVEENDACFFDQQFRAIDEENMKIERFKPEVQQVRVWVEDPKTGEPGKQGAVKIEYPKELAEETKSILDIL